MKKWLIGIAAVGLVVGAGAAVTQTSESVDVFVTTSDLKDEVVAAINELVVDVAALVASHNAAEPKGEVQTTSATNVVLTTFSPDNGNILYAANGTNVTLSINTDGTTNGWKSVVVPE